MKKFAIIDNDMDQARLVACWLRPYGFESTLYLSAELYVHATELHTLFDLVLVDWLLPGIDGLSIIKHIRNSPENIPIILITNKINPIDLAAALHAGADDYMSKPLNKSILIAKIGAVLRRYDYKFKITDQRIKIYLDPNKQLMRFNNQIIKITPQEYKIMELFLATEASRVVAREDLIASLWPDQKPTKNSRALDLIISRLRKKINAFKTSPGTIINQYGKGYLFVISK